MEIALPCVDEIPDRKVEPPPAQDVVPRKGGDIRVRSVLRLHQQSHRLQNNNERATPFRTAARLSGQTARDCCGTLFLKRPVEFENATS